MHKQPIDAVDAAATKPAIDAPEAKERKPAGLSVQEWRAIGAIVFAVIVVFGRNCGYPFVLWGDDAQYQTNRDLIGTSGVAHFWTGPYQYLYTPVFYSLIWLISAGSAPNPHVIHAVSLIVHCANSVLVYFLIRRLKLPVVASSVGAILFAVHPLQVGSVAWATDLSGVISSLFALAALHLYLGYAPGYYDMTLDRRLPWLAGIFIFYVCGLLTESSIVALPLIFIAMDTLVIRSPWMQAVRKAMPFLVAALIELLVMHFIQPTLKDMTVALWQRPLVMLDSYAFYIGKLLIPIKLGVDYGQTPAHVVAEPRLWLICLVPIGLLAWLLVSRVRGGNWGVGTAIFAAALFPVSGIVPFAYQHFSTVSDRYAYFAMIGPAIVLAHCIDRRPKLLYAAVAVLGLFAVMAFLQADTWRNSPALFRQTLNVNPNCYPAADDLALVYYRAGKWADAIKEFDRAASIDGTQTDPLIGIARSYAAEGNSSQSVIAYTRAVTVDPNCIPAYREATKILEIDGKMRQAISLYQEGINAEPESPVLRNDLGIIYASLHDFKDARAQFQAALDADSDYEPASQNLMRLTGSRR